MEAGVKESFNLLLKARRLIQQLGDGNLAKMHKQTVTELQVATKEVATKLEVVHLGSVSLPMNDIKILLKDYFIASNDLKKAMECAAPCLKTKPSEKDE